MRPKTSYCLRGVRRKSPAPRSTGSATLRSPSWTGSLDHPRYRRLTPSSKRAGSSGRWPPGSTPALGHSRSRRRYETADNMLTSRAESLLLAQALLRAPSDPVRHPRGTPARAGSTPKTLVVNRGKVESLPLVRALRRIETGVEREPGVIPARAGVALSDLRNLAHLPVFCLGLGRGMMIRPTIPYCFQAYCRSRKTADALVAGPRERRPAASAAR